MSTDYTKKSEPDKKRLMGPYRPAKSPAERQWLTLDAKLGKYRGVSYDCSINRKIGHHHLTQGVVAIRSRKSDAVGNAKVVHGAEDTSRIHAKMQVQGRS
ncbi:hypothetical protein NLO98_00450 [Pseudomonas syringae]|nr:hypothetical protein [Pseudomonas syringae]